MLESERLFYKKFEGNDFEDYVRLVGNNQLMRYITGKSLKRNEAWERFQGNLYEGTKLEGLGFFLVRLKRNRDLVGMVKVTELQPGHIELGYSLLPEYWNQSFGSEMLRTLISHAKEVPGTRSLIGITSQENIYSQKLLLNAGFEYVGRELATLDSSRIYKKALEP